MMQLKAGLSALVTGGASEIGRGLCIALAQNGIFVTVVDFCEDRGEEVVAISQKENLKFHSGLKFPSAIFVRCDLSNKGQVAAAFKKHMDVYGSLDICINCAGISNFVPFHEDQTDGWTHAINMNLLAVIDCTYRAIKILEAEEKPGVVINLGSASGLYPTRTDPIYSATQVACPSPSSHKSAAPPVPEFLMIRRRPDLGMSTAAMKEGEGDAEGVCA
ncbi:hypothetical protein LXL04_010618 [Taraxacum kok-saghyz]